MRENYKKEVPKWEKTVFVRHQNERKYISQVKNQFLLARLFHIMMLSYSLALILPYPHAVTLFCFHGPRVSRSRAFVPRWSQGLMCSWSQALIVSCSRALMLLFVCRFYCKYRWIIGRNQNASPSTRPTSARSAQVRPFHDVMPSCLRALEPSWSRTLMLSWIHALGLSNRHALLLSCLQALV